LTYKDRETSKMVVQLLLDERTQKQSEK